MFKILISLELCLSVDWSKVLIYFSVTFWYMSRTMYVEIYFGPYYFLLLSILCQCLSTHSFDFKINLYLAQKNIPTFFYFFQE